MVLWGDIKKLYPKKLKVSRRAMIPHKSHKYRAILDLSYMIQAKERTIKLVNKTTTKTPSKGAIDQMGNVINHIIHAYMEADDNEVIFAAKEDVKDGFWRCVAEEGEEWNFAYVLPQTEGEPTKVVVPVSLQMGWIKYPGYFCTASETGRDVGKEYA